MSSKIIVHCDLDAFYAAVETLHHGFDDETPLIIGSDPENGRGRGIVSTCNYAARKYGIKSAMSITEAWRRCPGVPYGSAIFIRGSRSLYSRASKMVMQILSGPADRFEQASIDEAYLDITKFVENDWDLAVSLCRDLQKEIMDSIGLSASFGIAQNRILAKMSSEVNKPSGIFRVLPDEISQFFAGRKIREVPGIGKKRTTQLAEWGITTIDEMYSYGELALSRITGDKFASWTTRVYEGRTSDEISVLRSRKSISKEHTFPVDLENYELVHDSLLILVKEVMKKSWKIGVSGRLAEVKIRYQGFETHTHSRAIPVAMDDEEVFVGLASKLFANNVQHDRKIRLVGFKLGQLDTPVNKQVTLIKSSVKDD